MKENMKVSASEQSIEPTKSVAPYRHFPEEKTTTYSELLTSDHDCPLSSILHLPLSNGVTDTSTSAHTIAPACEQFMPVHYPYPQERFQEDALKKHDEAVALSHALNFSNEELSVQNTCNPHTGERNTSSFPVHRVFGMKEEPSFSTCGEEMKSDSVTKATKILKNELEKQFATRLPKVSLPIKFGEKSRKRQRANGGAVKSAFQRKMDHLDKEKERRLRQTKCYDYLRSLVPCGNQKTDKANILEATVAYLTYIKETLGESMDLIDKDFLEEFERSKESTN